MPGEKDPTQAICTCPYCNSCVDQKTHVCQNCNKIIVPNQGRPHPRKVPQKGERYQDYGPKDRVVIPTVPLSRAHASTKIAKDTKKKKDYAEHDKTIVKDVFTSEFDQCLEPNRKNVDYKKEDIMRSCLDLAIDG